MFDLAQESFAKQGDRFFLEENGGVLIVSEAVLKKEHEEIQKKREILFLEREKVLEVVKQRVMKEVMQKEQERHKELEEKGIFGTEKRDFSGVMCMGCGDEPMDGVFVFPLCEEVHHYACLECLDIVIENNHLLVCPTCEANGDSFGMDEYRKTISGNEEVSAPAANLQAPASFSLTRDLPNEAVLLTEKTTVTLKNIEISEKLFFVLLEKTRVTVGENFSITGHARNEDCIREHGMMGETPFCLKRNVAVSPLALENIERMAPNSIGCSLKFFEFSDTGLINILPKLRIHGDSEIGWFSVTASEEAHVAEVLKQENPFCVGRVKNMNLEDYAVGVITKMSLKDCGIEYLSLHASEEAHVAAVLAQEKPFCVGRVKKMWLREYAVCVITKMSLKDCEIEVLVLDASEEAHVAEVPKQEKPFCLGRVKDMHLWDYAVGAITKMSLKDCEIEILSLTAPRKEHVAEVLKQENPFCVGRVKNMRFEDYAVCVITKMSLKDCEIEYLYLTASEEAHVAEVLAQENPFCVWRVKKMKLAGYAASVITKMSLKDCEIEYLELYAREEAQENPFCVGRVKKMVLGGYAVCVLTKMSLEDFEFEYLGLYANEEAHVAAVLAQEKPFCVGGVKEMALGGYAVCVLTKMSLKDCEIGTLWLNANEEEHVAGILKQEKPFCVGRVKYMYLWDYAVGVITKMSLKDCEIERLNLTAREEAHVAAVLAQKKPFCVGRVKDMNLKEYAVSVITKMTIHGDNTMEDFVLRGHEDCFSKIIGEGDNSIELGRIRTDGLCVPEKIKRKLRYTLVDGEGKEVLEEEEPGQRGNLLE
ncbi:MAG: uncharacterized protein A8A55_2668 [Amphiamblys sp. WSBS2006]|nr:MAG: uncharacterized protein A8A55_2668 [Amphiamblys sp. WSBS2006]